MMVSYNGKEIDSSDLVQGRNYWLVHPIFKANKPQFRITYPSVLGSGVEARVVELSGRDNKWKGIVPIVEDVPDGRRSA